MSLTAVSSRTYPISLWRDVICPKEHGSWSLALEPVALALLVAPSIPGSLLATSLIAAFFARRPLRLVFRAKLSDRPAAWRGLAWCGASAVAAFAGAVALAGPAWLVWLAPVAITGAGFVYFDLRGEGRAEAAELIGATAFALTPMAMAILAGRPTAEAVTLGLLMVARAAPSVATVRAFLRAAKTGVRRDALAVGGAVGAFAISLLLCARGWSPMFAVVAMALFLARTLLLLVVVRPAWRARTVGMSEAMLGAGYVLALAFTWGA